MSEATRKAVDQLSAEALRDRAVYVDTSYLISSAYPSPENLFYVAELRNKLLVGGVRLADKRDKAQIVLEVRSGGIGIDRLEYLLGIPSIYLSGAAGDVAGANAAAGDAGAGDRQEHEAVWLRQRGVRRLLGRHRRAGRQLRAVRRARR